MNLFDEVIETATQAAITLVGVIVAALIAFTLWVGTAAPAEARERVLVIETGNPWSEGGSPRRYLREMQKYDRIEIRGRCFSACTKFLGHENVCVDRQKAKLGFHKPSWFGVVPAGDDIALQFAQFYRNPKLENWYMENAPRSPFAGAVLSGAKLINDFGVKACR